MEEQEGRFTVTPPPASEDAHTHVAVKETEALAKFCSQLIKGLYEDLKHDRVPKHHLAHVVDDDDQLILIGFDPGIPEEDLRTTMLPGLSKRYKRIGFQQESWYVPPDKTQAYCDAGCPDLATWPDAGTLFMLRCECRHGGIETMIKVAEGADGKKVFAAPPELNIYGSARGMFFYNLGDTPTPTPTPPSHSRTTTVEELRGKIGLVESLSSES